MREPSSPRPRARVVAGYVLGDVLGEGTFGKVRSAEKDGAKYAVKILDRALIDTNEWSGKVRREIAIMRALSHPSIVQLHQVIRSPSRVYLVMELVAGGELYWKVQNEGALQESLARCYFQQLVDGVAYCHSRGVYHRDLKPENLLLSENGTLLKVTDFGLSAVNPTPDIPVILRTPCGSPHYCAPEVRGRRVDPGYNGEKIDAWSCGVILFLLCTGWLPFHHEKTENLQAQIDSGIVHYPDSMPKGAREICASLLETNPYRRAGLSEVRAHPWFQVDYKPLQPKRVRHSRMKQEPARNRSKSPVKALSSDAISSLGRRKSLGVDSVHRLPRKSLTVGESSTRGPRKSFALGEITPRLPRKLNGNNDGTSRASRKSFGRESSLLPLLRRGGTQRDVLSDESGNFPNPSRTSVPARGARSNGRSRRRRHNSTLGEMSSILGNGVWKSATRKTRSGRWRIDRDGLCEPGSVITQHSSSVELVQTELDKLASNAAQTASTEHRSFYLGVLKDEVRDMGVQISRAPSLEVGDAPSSPGGAYGKKRVDSSLSSRHSSTDDWSAEAGRKTANLEKTTNDDPPDRVEPERVKGKPALGFKMFGAEFSECQDVPPGNAERPSSRGGSGSLRLRIFGARMLSNLGPKWKNRTPVPS